MLFATPSRADDDWFGSDKALHFGVSVVIAGGGYAASALVFEDRLARVACGAGLGVAAGAGKEFLDLAGYGTPSWKDFTWDLIGNAVGVLAALSIDLLLSKRTVLHTASPPVESAGVPASGLRFRF